MLHTEGKHQNKQQQVITAETDQY